MMNNEHMKEAQEGSAVLEDVEDDTFVGFCEFAYTGDYRSRMMERRPEIENNIGAGYGTGVEWEEGVVPTPPEASEPTMADEPTMVDEITAAPTEYWDFGELNRRRTTERRIPITKAERLWSDFKSLEFEDKHLHESDKQLPAANGCLSSASQTVESLLYHAKIYLFAEKYLIDNLRIFSLRKLHASLQDFDLTLQTSGDILELLEFAYTHTARQESSENELRALVVHYAACKIEILKKNVNLRSLLEANGEMGCDLLYKI
jgi:hypothetical protein